MLEAQGRFAAPEGEEPGQRCCNAGGAGRHVREEGGSAPRRLAQEARRRQPRALVYQRTWVLFSNGMLCWLHCRVAGAWGRRSWLGDAAGPAPRLPMALLPDQRGSSHCGLPVQCAAWAGKTLRVSSSAQTSAWMRCSRRVTLFLCWLRHSRSGNKATSFSSTWRQCQTRLLRPPVPEQISDAHVLTGTQHSGREADSHPVVCALAPLLLMLPVHMSPFLRLTAMPTFK